MKSKYEGLSNFSTFKSDEYFKNRFAGVSPEKI